MIYKIITIQDKDITNGFYKDINGDYHRITRHISTCCARDTIYSIVEVQTDNPEPLEYLF